jgi:cytochrome c553
LVERRATGVTDALRALAISGPTTASRLHALWTLEGIGALRSEDAQRAMLDSDPVLRATGLRVGEPWLTSGETARAAIARLVEDPDRWVRLQAILSAGLIEGPEAFSIFERALDLPRDDGIVRDAVISGLAGRTPEFLRKTLATDWMASSVRRPFIADLFDCVLRSKNLEERATLVELITDLAPGNPQAAEFLLARLRRAQQLDSPTARLVEIGREPRGWAALAASADKLGPVVKESDYYLTWPGKPHVDPPRRLRPLSTRELARYEAGNALFTNGCAACHAHDGTGIPGQIPPLAGSARAQGNDARSIRILLHGLAGAIETAEGSFNGAMPPAPFHDDEQIASVLTYIRRAWGNSGDPVDPYRVKAIRAQAGARTEPWTAAELEQVK